MRVFSDRLLILITEQTLVCTEGRLLDSHRHSFLLLQSQFVITDLIYRLFFFNPIHS